VHINKIYWGETAMKSLDISNLPPVSHIDNVGCIFTPDERSGVHVNKTNIASPEHINKNLIPLHPPGRSASIDAAADRFLNFRQIGVVSRASVDPARKAARALHGREKLVICIGANTRNENNAVVPSKEGIRGALVLGISARDTGKAVTYVSDAPTAAIIEEMLKSSPPAPGDGEGNMHDIEVHSFNAISDEGGLQSTARMEAREILETTQADAVVTIALPDAGSLGDANKPIYEVARAAHAENLLVVSVGNGSDKTVGFGATPTTLSVPGTVSNFTAMALGALLLKNHGIPGQFIKPADFKELPYLVFNKTETVTSQTAGAPRQSILESLQEKNLLEPYIDMNDHMLELAKKLAYAHGESRLDLLRPTEIAIFDSSNGAFVAANVLKREFEKLGYETNFIIVVDHGNAPYGQYVGEKREELYRLVSSGLKVCEGNGAELVVMACNTACIVPKAQTEIDVPVVDLIQVTAKAIARDGGNNPVLVSTLATTCSNAYPDAVLRESGHRVDLRRQARQSEEDDAFVNMISAPGLAELINKMGATAVGKKDEDSAHDLNAEANELIKHIIAKVPSDATSVWLTCTHYPVFQSKFEDALRKRDLDIKVINPMTYQAKAVVAEIGKLTRQGDLESEISVPSGANIVLSSAPNTQKAFIEASVEALFGPAVTECESWTNSPAT
jgi:glutamate racemase